MAHNIRPCPRDLAAIELTERSPLLTSQLTDLLWFPSTKKAAERLCELHRAGYVQRTPYYQRTMQGKPEFVYYRGARPHPRTLQHTIGIAAVHVDLTAWLRHNKEYTATFYYTHEAPTSTGIIPDATIIMQKHNATALFFIEVDTGTESLTSTSSYSLNAKLHEYAAYFDNGAYQQDFGKHGDLRGFRVAIVMPQRRLHHLQGILAREGLDFVQLTTPDHVREGWDQPVWTAYNGTMLDFFGRTSRGIGGGVGQATTPHHHEEQLMLDQPLTTAEGTGF